MTGWNHRGPSRRLAAAGILVPILLLASCGLGSSEVVAGPDGLSHIHDIVVEPDGTVLIAAHTGLYRLAGC